MKLFDGNLVLQIIFCLVIGYCFGMFSSGYFIGKIHHVDLKHEGSGNLGTTNVLRVIGLRAGICTLIIDLAKTMIPILLVRYLFFTQFEPFTNESNLLVLYTSLGAVCGHLFPFYLKFQGGKGIACMGACMLIYSQHFELAGIGLFFFLGTLILSKYMSLASLVASVIFPIYVGITSGGDIHMIIVTVLFTFSAFYNHRTNIKRLLNGTENKFSVKKKTKD